MHLLEIHPAASFKPVLKIAGAIEQDSTQVHRKEGKRAIERSGSASQRSAVRGNGSGNGKSGLVNIPSLCRCDYYRPCFSCDKFCSRATRLGDLDGAFYSFSCSSSSLSPTRESLKPRLDPTERAACGHCDLGGCYCSCGREGQRSE